jgi:hypothetical protein
MSIARYYHNIKLHGNNREWVVTGHVGFNYCHIVACPSKGKRDHIILGVRSAELIASAIDSATSGTLIERLDGASLPNMGRSLACSGLTEGSHCDRRDGCDILGDRRGPPELLGKHACEDQSGDGENKDSSSDIGWSARDG